MEEFKKGDVVCLRSNPSMKFTVCGILDVRGRTEIQIVYFNEGNNRFEYHSFVPEVLSLV